MHSQKDFIPIHLDNAELNKANWIFFSCRPFQSLYANVDLQEGMEEAAFPS